MVLVSITESGLALLERLDGPVGQYTGAVMAGLSPHKLRELCALLDQVRAGIQPFP